MSSDLMKAGAKVPDVNEPFLDEGSRECLLGAADTSWAGANGASGAETTGELLDWLRVCEGGVDDAPRALGEENMVDFGRLTLPAPCGVGDALANGLLRRDMEPLALKDISNGEHQPRTKVCSYRKTWCWLGQGELDGQGSK